MNKFIIGYGLVTNVATTYTKTLADALFKARQFSEATGLSAEEAAESDISWAEPFDLWLARDLGLAVWDDGYDGRAAPTPTSPKDGWMMAEARK